MLCLILLLSVKNFANGNTHQFTLHPVKKLDPLPTHAQVSMPHISTSDVQTLLDRAYKTIDSNIQKYEVENAKKGIVLTKGSPAWFMALSRTGSESNRNLCKSALIAEETTKYLTSIFQLNESQIYHGLPQLSTKNTQLGEKCPEQVDYPCQPRRYRAFTGYCNNVQNPRWGNANTRLLRFLPPDYSDFVSLPRGGGLIRNSLPSARDVSLIVHSGADRPHQHLMAITAVWGEFIAHDLAQIPQNSGYGGHQLKCCGVSYANFHPECFPIRLPDNDPVHSHFGERCQDYVRSTPAPRAGCTFGPREQLNQATSFLDASVIYGDSKEKADSLREFSGGRLRVQSVKTGGPLLPPILDGDSCRPHEIYRCFDSGDIRVNEHLGLAAIHTIWLREHNRVAAVFQELNPHWSDETLYQEARRLIGAEIQHITYSEYLPMVIGQEAMDKYGLNPESFAYYSGYDININPGLANAVAAAALKFVSSLLPKSLSVVDGLGHEIEQLDIAATSYAPFKLYELRGLDNVIRGLINEAAQYEDNHINEIMTNHMFQDKAERSGLDLAAQIIQQGRDHGIPGYVFWRDFCKLGTVKSFDDLLNDIEDNVISSLKSVYENVTDIDLFTGLIAERPLIGAVVGPTLACLLGRQFHALRRGDRYWYENDLPPSSFPKDQLNEIRKTSLARVICDNADTISSIQPQVFLSKDPFLNAVMSCKKGMIKSMNLEPWKERHRRFQVPQQLLAEAVEKARWDVAQLIAQERGLFEQQKAADPLSSVGTAFGFNRPKRQAAEVANTSLILQFVSSRFVTGFLQEHLQDLESGIKDVEPRDLQQLMEVLPNVDLTDYLDIPRVFSCEEQTLPCDHTHRYRSISGWCNNLKTPGKGKSLRAFSRILPPAYDDRIGSPRQISVTGQLLPSPRLISIKTHPDTNRPHVRYSLMFMQFAQLLDHDLTHTPVNKAFVGEFILNCRPCDAMTSVHPECFPIPVPEGDTYFPKVNISSGKPLCIPVTRSMPGQLTLGHREQLNQVTAYIDSSFVYGSDVCESKILRSFIGGRLNITSRSFGKPLMPQITTHPECKSKNKVCFRGGDARASEQPGLASLHTIFMREHNRLVDQLARLNPHWTDENLYQQARRILSAATQHITFSELVPRILGWDGVHQYGLDLESEGYFKDYDENCDATIVNEFAAAAFRFGHSLLRPSLLRLDKEFKLKEPSVRLRDTFFNPEVLYQPGMVDELLRGLLASSMETLDQFITSEVTNHLFEDHKIPYSGMDLAAINIQRGRDHGIRSYNHYRAHCNLTAAKRFDDLKIDIPSPIVESLRSIYADVDDIDLFPGGLSETPLLGGVVGPTFACIIGEQFQRLRKCDRFWYETDNPMLRFNEAQLMEVRKVTLSKIICENSDSIDTIQRHVMDLPDPFLNPIVPCKNLPSINLELWKDRSSCTVGGLNIPLGTGKRVSPCVMCTCTKEGPMCQSLKIANCFHLINTFNKDSVLNDNVCKVQCAFVLRASQKSAVESGRAGKRQLGFS